MLRLVLDTQIWLDWLVFDDPGVRDLRVAVEKGRAEIWMDADDCAIEDLFVREADQRRGLGTAMVKAALERARGRGCRRVELKTHASNERSRVSSALYLFKDGRWSVFQPPQVP